MKKLRKHNFGFWEIFPKPSCKELSDYYTNKYYQDALGSYEHTYSEGELSFFNAKLEQKYSVLINKMGRNQNPRKFLDIGCGEGFALAYFRKQGWSVKGIDFSSTGVESKNPVCLDVLETGDVFLLLDEEVKSGNKYDVVWLQNVLEHVLEPIALLHSLKFLLENDGVVAITVPNDFSVTQQKALMLGHIDNQFWVSPPDHLSYFNHISLLATAEATGWTCFELLADFPIDWFLFNSNSNYVKNKSVGKSAHYARVQIENLIHSQGVEIANNFYSTMAKLGLGRSLTAFLQSNKT